MAYDKGFKLAMEIFEVSKKFPKEETYSLTDQIRRSTRSVCANIAEAYRKSSSQSREFEDQSEEIGRLIQFMINNPGKFGVQ